MGVNGNNSVGLWPAKENAVPSATIEYMYAPAFNVPKILIFSQLAARCGTGNGVPETQKATANFAMTR